MNREKIKLSDLTHFSDKQKEADKGVKNHRYVLYGGAMAGGKSYWLRWELVKLLVKWAKEGHRNVEVGLFCEDYPTLKDRQLSKIGAEFPQWLGTNHGDHPQHGRCYILSEEYGGGIIKFRNLDDPSKYQSAEFAAIAVDELTKNTEEVFDDLRNRLRWSGIKDVRFIAATNPGGIGHAWVKKRWIDRQFPEEETEPKEFVYIRALAQDNPHIDKSYLKQLESLPPDKRRAYLEGDWDIFKGQYFTEFRREIHVAKPFRIPDEWKKFEMGDYGQTNPSAIYWGAVSPDGQLYVYRELYKTGMNYSDVGREIASMRENNEDIGYTVFDPALWSKEPASTIPLTGAEIIQQSFREATDKKRSINLMRGNNDRLAGWGLMREYLKPYLKNGELTAKLQIFDTCVELIRTLPSLVYDEHRVEDLDTDGEDHAADAIRYGIMSRPRPTMTPEQLAQRDFDEMRRRQQGHRQRQRLFVK